MIKMRLWAVPLLFAITATCLAYGDATSLAVKEASLERRLLDILLVPGAEAQFREEIDQLRKELKEVKDELKKLTDGKHLEKTNHGWFSGFFQNQYVDNSAGGSTSDAFRSRRQRLNYNHIGDSRTMGRISIDFAAGVNQTTAQIRDAFIQYRPNTYLAKSGPTYTIGGQNTPLGYEISYASWARTWPERALYNPAFHNGERGRGAIYQNGDNANYWFAGMWNGLTVNDIEAVNNPQGPGGEVGPIAGFHIKRGAWEGGLSGMAVRRPAVVTTAEPTDRRFVYADFRYHPTKSKFDLRGEYMTGRDRVAGLPSTVARDVSGFHLNLDAKINPKDIYVLRYEQFDSNTAVGGGVTTLGNINLYGVGYVREVNQFLRLQFAHEWVSSSSYLKGYQASTIRVQFRF
jgi:hypothetical protein